MAPSLKLSALLAGALARGADAFEPLAWTEAYRRAEETLSRMEWGEKHSLLRGIGWDGWELRKWWYVGNTPAISRLNIPSLNMQDAAGGFRTYWGELVGTVTCWPSALALAATWDPQLVRAFAEAAGEEFVGKGANGILGPSIEVHRVARGGRNFEYLSGEDPYLGARLTEAYVEGVQSKGVFAIMKHWVFNHQETNRGSENSVVDEQTAWELYYPPFQAAVDAGVSGAMCSYNRIDGLYSCANEQQLQSVLRQRMGFQGFVQSDWWAVHGTSLAQGLDQDMPGLTSEEHFNEAHLRQQSPSMIDRAVRRILAVVHRMGLAASTRCVPPYCEAWMRRNVTSDGHAQLARTLTARSIVLLKNEGGLLPLLPQGPVPVRTIAVIGAASVAEAYNPHGVGQGQANAWAIGDYYSGGGSGHIVAGRVVTPLEGIRGRAAAAGVRVVASPSNDIAAALEAVRGADVAIVVGATTSGETRDRADLSLDDGADGLIAAVAAACSNTVVLMQLPGAVVMPWRDSVAAILTMFLGGQATGSAWADVLFGDLAPTGRLPVMMPATEADTIPPNSAHRVGYAEGMHTSYRNRNFQAAFPFGHGLTYTSFEYLPPAQVPCLGAGAQGPGPRPLLCVGIAVRNAGAVAAATVAQLYLELPAAAGHPAPFLKGFQGTGTLAPGATAELVFPLTQRDVSYFDVSVSAWTPLLTATAHIGESSRDIRHSLPLLVDASRVQSAPAPAVGQEAAAPGPNRSVAVGQEAAEPGPARGNRSEAEGSSSGALRR